MTKFPSLKQLHYLVTLHETRHFGDAAKRCFVSQSTLSAGIQNLEELLNFQLIERDHKRLIFSSIGEDVVRQSREILARSQDLMSLAEYGELPMHGKLRMGCIPTIAPFLLCDLVKAINQNYPNLDLLLREDTTANLLLALRRGEMDVLILALPVDLQGMTSRIVGIDRFKMVMNTELANQYEQPLRYKDLPDESVFLLEKEHCLTEHAIAACQLTYVNKINPFSATSLHTLVQMVANGLGTTFLPEMALNHGLIENMGLTVIEPSGENAFRKIGLVWRPSTRRHQTFQLLGDLVESLL